jgi:putative hemolysin
MDWMSLIAIIVSLIFIGFFAGIEIAFVSVSKLSIELRKKQGSYAGKTWSAFMEKPASFIGTILVALNIVLVIYGLLWSDILDSAWKYAGIQNPFLKLTVETIISTILLLFFEFIFKAFFRARNNAVIGSIVITFIVSFFYSMFAWIATFFVNIAEWMLKYIFNVKLQNKSEAFTKIDLEHFIQQSNMHDAEDEEMNNELFENVLSLSDVKVRECLIPRKEIESISIDISLEEVKARFIETKLSKLVVFEENIDNIKGYIHQLDLFRNPQSLRSMLLPIPAIPESMSATDLINKFSKERKSIAWVIDEFGGTAGIVTMEDLLEEIFGDINDEYDNINEQFVDKQISTTEFILSGRLELDYLINKYKMEFRKNEETETLSGYIISQHESIPRQKDRIIIDDYQFDILSVKETRIDTVKLKVLR